MPKKILIIRFSAIGDIIWTTPAIRCLKTQLPDTELHFCTKAIYADMLAANPYIDRLILLQPQQSLRQLVSLLRAEQYDTVIDLHLSLRSRLITWQLGKPTYTYKKYNWQRWLFVRFKINRLPARFHAADRYLDALKPLGIVPDGRGLDYVIPPSQRVSVASLPTAYQGGYVVVVIGASAFTKKLPTPRLIELCERIAQPIVLVGGKEDAAAGEEIEAHFAQHTNQPVFNACGKYSIGQSSSLVAQAKYVFGHDTGLTHIASAFGKHVYAIYGGTSHIGFSPYQTEYTLLARQDLSCRPCSRAGRDRCPLGHFKCLAELPLDFTLPDEH